MNWTIICNLRMNNEYKNRQETAFQLFQHVFQTGSLSVVRSITISVSMGQTKRSLSLHSNTIFPCNDLSKIELRDVVISFVDIQISMCGFIILLFYQITIFAFHTTCQKYLSRQNFVLFWSSIAFLLSLFNSVGLDPHFKVPCFAITLFRKKWARNSPTCTNSVNGSIHLENLVRNCE